MWSDIFKNNKPYYFETTGASSSVRVACTALRAYYRSAWTYYYSDGTHPHIHSEMHSYVGSRVTTVLSTHTCINRISVSCALVRMRSAVEVHVNAPRHFLGTCKLLAAQRSWYITVKPRLTITHSTCTTLHSPHLLHIFQQFRQYGW